MTKINASQQNTLDVASTQISKDIVGMRSDDNTIRDAANLNLQQVLADNKDLLVGAGGADGQANFNGILSSLTVLSDTVDSPDESSAVSNSGLVAAMNNLGIQFDETTKLGHYDGGTVGSNNTAGSQRLTALATTAKNLVTQLATGTDDQAMNANDRLQQLLTDGAADIATQVGKPADTLFRDFDAALNRYNSLARSGTRQNAVTKSGIVAALAGLGINVKNR